MTRLRVRVQEEIGAAILIPVDPHRADGARVIRVPRARRDPMSIIAILKPRAPKMGDIGAVQGE